MLHLSNGLLSVQFDGNLSLPALKGLFRFLQPYFWEANAGYYDLRFEIDSFDARPNWLASKLGEEQQFRKSSAAPFNLWIKSGAASDGAIVGRDDRTDTAYEFVSPFHVRLWISDASLYHLIELFRYSALTMIQSCKISVLHASAVRLGDRAVLITGEKGAGKTTTLIQLVMKFGGQVVSGDKVLLFVQDGKVMAKGWPDFPHIGGGTFSHFADLSVELGLAVQDWITQENVKVKHLIDPHSLYEALGEPHAGALMVETIIFPNVAAKTKLQLLNDREIADRLAPNFEHSVQYSVLDWHGLGGSRGISDNAEILSLLSKKAGIQCDGFPIESELRAMLG